MFASLGIGYIHAKAQEEGIWAYHLTIPVRVSYDLCPHTSLLAKAEYQLMLFKHSQAPRDIVTATLGLQYHLGR